MGFGQGFGGRMSSVGQCFKLGLFISNFLIFIGGAIVLGIGLWNIIDNNYANELLGTNLYAGAIYILTASAAIVCIVSFFGCLGAAKEVKCMLLTYFIILFLIFVTMLIGGILGYVFREKVAHTMKQEMLSTMRQYRKYEPYTHAWDTTQTRLKCCGVEYYRDWTNYYGSIPETCCQETYGGQRKPCITNPNPANIYNQGCFNVTATHVQDHAAIIGGAGIGVAFLMLLGMIFSCGLFIMIK